MADRKCVLCGRCLGSDGRWPVMLPTGGIAADGCYECFSKQAADQWHRAVGELQAPGASEQQATGTNGNTR